MNWMRIVCLVSIMACDRAIAGGDVGVDKCGDSLVDPAALTIDGRFGRHINGLSFQQDVILTHGDYQYVTYYDAARRVCIARRKLPAGEWQVVRFDDCTFKSNDAQVTIRNGCNVRHPDLAGHLRRRARRSGSSSIGTAIWLRLCRLREYVAAS